MTKEITAEQIRAAALYTLRASRVAYRPGDTIFVRTVVGSFGPETHIRAVVVTQKLLEEAKRNP